MGCPITAVSGLIAGLPSAAAATPQAKRTGRIQPGGQLGSVLTLCTQKEPDVVQPKGQLPVDGLAIAFCAPRNGTQNEPEE